MGPAHLNLYKKLYIIKIIYDKKNDLHILFN